MLTANLKTDGIGWPVAFLTVERFSDRAPVTFVSAAKPFALISQAIENILHAKNCGYKEK